jgi:hypothetical protein
MYIIQIPCCLDRVIAKFKERQKGIPVAVLLDVPARRLGTGENPNSQQNSWDESRAQL